MRHIFLTCFFVCTLGVAAQNCDKFVGSWTDNKGSNFTIVKNGDIFKLKYRGSNYRSEDASVCVNGQLTYEEMKMTYSSQEDIFYWDGRSFKRVSGPPVKAATQENTASTQIKPPVHVSETKTKPHAILINALALTEDQKWSKPGSSIYFDSIAITITDEVHNEISSHNEVTKFLSTYLAKVDTSTIRQNGLNKRILEIILTNDYYNFVVAGTTEWNINGKAQLIVKDEKGSVLFEKSNKKLKALGAFEVLKFSLTSEEEALHFYHEKKLNKELQKYLDAFFK